MKRTPRAPRSGPSPRPPAARALPAAPAPSPPRRVRAPRAAPAASPARRRPRRRRGAARPRGDPRRSPSSSRCPFASSAAPGTCAEISEMTRGQVASVSIGSGFRNAPGMPEPNIFNMWRRRAQLPWRVAVLTHTCWPSVLQPLESYTDKIRCYERSGSRPPPMNRRRAVSPPQGLRPLVLGP